MVDSLGEDDTGLHWYYWRRPLLPVEGFDMRRFFAGGYVTGAPALPSAYVLPIDEGLDHDLLIQPDPVRACAFWGAGDGTVAGGTLEKRCVDVEAAGDVSVLSPEPGLDARWCDGWACEGSGLELALDHDVLDDLPELLQDEEEQFGVVVFFEAFAVPYSVVFGAGLLEGRAWIDEVDARLCWDLPFSDEVPDEEVDTDGDGFWVSRTVYASEYDP